MNDNIIEINNIKNVENLSKKVHEEKPEEIKTAENNSLFFTAKSKTANKLVDDMQKKINDLKKQLDELQAKLDAEDE